MEQGCELHPGVLAPGEGEGHNAIRMRMGCEHDASSVKVPIDEHLNDGGARSDRHRFAEDGAVVADLTRSEARAIFEDQKQPHIGGVPVTLKQGGGETVAAG